LSHYLADKEEESHNEDAKRVRLNETNPIEIKSNVLSIAPFVNSSLKARNKNYNHNIKQPKQSKQRK
jgi:hypothetical protein